MPIIVVCRNCRTRFQVSEKFAGRRGPCPKCKAAIYIPKPEEEVKIHVPEHSEAGARGASGNLALKPIARIPTRIAMWQWATIAGGIIGLLLAALTMRWLPDASQVAAVCGLLVLSPPLAVAGYTFLRDQELEPHGGLWLWLRAGLCGLLYAACWGAYVLLPDVATDELWKWVFVGPGFGLAGAVIALATLDLDLANGFFHFAFYVLVTMMLAAAMGLSVI